ncbi:MAG: DUF167 family protein [Steroidobacteraceae bacterium]
MNWFRWDGADLILQLKIQPGARRSEFAGLHGERLKLRIHAAAVAGRANAELQAFLCTTFATGKSNIHIEQGELGRIKCVRIQTPRKLPDELSALGLSAPSS